VAEQVGNMPVEMKRMLVVKFAPVGCCEPPVHCDCDCWVADTVAAAGEEMVWWLYVRVLYNWYRALKWQQCPQQWCCRCLVLETGCPKKSHAAAELHMRHKDKTLYHQTYHSVVGM